MLSAILETSSLISVPKVSNTSVTSSLKSPNLPSTLVSDSTINFLYAGTSSPKNSVTFSDNVLNSSLLQIKY